jgi:hypothetical protein
VRLHVCLSVCVRERERETILINVNRRISINLLKVLQQSLQTPGRNRKLIQTG